MLQFTAWFVNKGEGERDARGTGGFETAQEAAEDAVRCSELDHAIVAVRNARTFELLVFTVHTEYEPRIHSCVVE